MESKNLVICDPETKFASAFAQYLTRQKELAVRVRTCSDLSYVLAIQEKEKIDFLINTSESEGVPVSMMEAMSYGIPVVGHGLPGHGHYLRRSGPETSRHWYAPAIAAYCGPTPIRVAQTCATAANYPGRVCQRLRKGSSYRQ